MNSSFDPEDLQAHFSTLATCLLAALVVYFLSELGLSSLLSPTNFLRQVGEMASLGIPSILSGRAVEWAAVNGGIKGDEGSSSGREALAGLGLDKGKGKMVRRYQDTSQGASGQYYPGLLNAAGNLCFLNATLQSMASLPTLVAYLDSLTSFALTLGGSTPVTTMLLDTLTALNTPSSSRPSPLRPLALANALADSSASRRRLLASSDQQDAHELWGMIRDAIEEEASRVAALEERRKQAVAGLAEVVRLKAGFSTAALGTRNLKKRENDPWFFLRSQRIRCMTCGYVRDTRHEGEELLMLQVPPISHCSLYDLLAEYTKTDLLSDYACRRCSMLATLAKLQGQRDRLAQTPSSSPLPPSSAPSTPSNPFELPPEPQSAPLASAKMTASKKDRRRKVQKLVDRVQAVVDAGDFEAELGEDVKMERTGGAAGKSVRLARTPDVLLVHLNRSTHYGYSGPIKNSCAVSFPEILDVSPFCDGTPSSSTADSVSPVPSSSTRDLYRLSSLVVHYGSHHFGHYVAFRRRPSSLSSSPSTSSLPAWYRISDETVEPSSIDETLRANPFLLFYERVPIGEDAGSAFETEEGKRRVEAILNGAKARFVESWRAIGRGTTKPQEEPVQNGGAHDEQQEEQKVAEEPTTKQEMAGA
ncbi:hypothetical protein JCM21900_001618 [Sporobolomyces salmonicolor]